MRGEEHDHGFVFVDDLDVARLSHHEIDDFIQLLLLEAVLEVLEPLMVGKAILDFLQDHAAVDDLADLLAEEARLALQLGLHVLHVLDVLHLSFEEHDEELRVQLVEQFAVDLIVVALEDGHDCHQDFVLHVLQLSDVFGRLEQSLLLVFLLGDELAHVAGILEEG